MDYSLCNFLSFICSPRLVLKLLKWNSVIHESLNTKTNYSCYLADGGVVAILFSLFVSNAMRIVFLGRKVRI